eukprot:TRINITY_DN1075_c2_g2_i1.p1 TRINITY_DN1075_c2_g2~~TRINITY_DN1075_c2_g2_i1.p1  ORF type:complete len:230 (-),score=9.90 TRINITY_DN1075_c2_g2_i1:188-877(-)
MSSNEYKVHLGRDRYLTCTTYKDNVYVHIRCFQEKQDKQGQKLVVPTKTGIALTAHEFDRLISQGPDIQKRSNELKERVTKRKLFFEKDENTGSLEKKKPHFAKSDSPSDNQPQAGPSSASDDHWTPTRSPSSPPPAKQAQEYWGASYSWVRVKKIYITTIVFPYSRTKILNKSTYLVFLLHRSGLALGDVIIIRPMWIHYLYIISLYLCFSDCPARNTRTGDSRYCPK